MRRNVVADYSGGHDLQQFAVSPRDDVVTFTALASDANALST